MTAAKEGRWRPSDTLANRFRLVRAELGISQREMAERVGLTPAQIQNIEDGRAARSLDVKIRAIAQQLGVDRDWLMWGGELAPSPFGPGGIQCPRADSNSRQTRYKVARKWTSVVTPSDLRRAS